MESFILYMVPGNGQDVTTKSQQVVNRMSCLCALYVESKEINL